MAVTGGWKLSLCVAHCQLLIESVRQLFASLSATQKWQAQGQFEEKYEEKFEEIFLKSRQASLCKSQGLLLSFTHSIYISRLLRAAPHTEYLMGVTRQVELFSHKILLFDLSPHNHWHGANFNIQYFVLEMLGIEIESLAVRGCLNILSV